jgi:putative membrane protein
MNRLVFELIQGLLIGAGAILPGISGASLAVVFGVYEDFTGLLAHPVREFRPFLKKHAILAVGIAAGFILFTLLLDRLFAKHTVTLIFLFSGFIAGTLPGIYGRAKKEGIGVVEIFAFILTLGIFIALTVFPPVTGGHGLAVTAGNSALITNPVAWLVSGAIIGAGSLMPGVSASFILIYIGMYGPLLDALGKRAIFPLILTGLGALASLVLLSRLVNFLFSRFHGIVSFAILGFTLGSLVMVFPGLQTGPVLFLDISLAFAGFAASFFLEKTT